MSSLFNTPGPNFSDDQAISIVNNLYDLNISIIKPLSSDRDQNFLLYQDDKPVYVLKISHQDEMFNVLDSIKDYMPKNKPRYLMGVGTPSDIIGAVARGVDMFDCVMPTRSGRTCLLYTSPSPRDRG